MATSPTTTSAPLSGAAKDDTVGLNDDFTFTVKELLANDAASAAKVALGSQFFFGDTAADQANQAAYLDAHGITKISDDNGGTYSIDSDAIDFSYFVQIGNKGTWSQADVTVADTPEPTWHYDTIQHASNIDLSLGLLTSPYPSNGEPYAVGLEFEGALPFVMDETIFDLCSGSLPCHAYINAVVASTSDLRIDSTGLIGPGGVGQPGYATTSFAVVNMTFEQASHLDPTTLTYGTTPVNIASLIGNETLIVHTTGDRYAAMGNVTAVGEASYSADWSMFV